jgi:NDP-sugar pyrophosphorylase family protein
MKRLIPSFLKNLIWQFYLRVKHSRKNKIGKGVIFSKDFIIGENCTIGRNTIIGVGVKIANNVKVGSNCRLEKIEIGDNSCIEGGVIITGFGNGQIKIGKECYI